MADEPSKEFATTPQTQRTAALAQLREDMEAAEARAKRYKFYGWTAAAVIAVAFSAGLGWSTVVHKTELHAFANEQRHRQDQLEAQQNENRANISRQDGTLNSLTRHLEHIERSIEWSNEAMFKFMREERLNVTPPPHRATMHP